MTRRPLKVFFCYAHEDRAERDALDAHLELMRREGLLATWHDGELAGGVEWSVAIQEALRGSDLVIMLLSPAFFASTYIAEVEMRLALEAHREGTTRIVPVLLEELDAPPDLPILELQMVAADRPLRGWEDPERGLQYAAGQIRRAAMAFLIERGGAFEFGSHAFTEAELERMTPEERGEALAGLGALRRALVDEVPERVPHENLLVATWCLNKLGRGEVRRPSIFYIAQVVSAFDVVCLQEIHRDLGPLREVLAALGPEWGYLITDVTEGRMGNSERFAIVYYEPRVTFEHVSGEVVLADKLLERNGGAQFARKPLVASFRSGRFPFRLCTAHVRFSQATADREASARECGILAAYLQRLSEREGENIVLAGNFNYRRPDSREIAALVDGGFAIDPDTLHPSTFTGRHHTDLIGLMMREPGTVRVGRSGAFAPLQHVYREEDAEAHLPGAKKGRWRMWRTGQISDHRPVWVELRLADGGAADGNGLLDTAGGG